MSHKVITADVIEYYWSLKVKSIPNFYLLFNLSIQRKFYNLNNGN